MHAQHFVLRVTVVHCDPSEAGHDRDRMKPVEEAAGEAARWLLERVVTLVPRGRLCAMVYSSLDPQRHRRGPARRGKMPKKRRR